MPLALKPSMLSVLAMLLSCGASAAPPHEPHQRLDTADPAHARDVALTLDACGGAYDGDVITTLVRLKVPATVFVTRRWLDANPVATRALLAHTDLFEIENHGRDHVPAVVGGTVYGLRGPRDVAGIEREVAGGAQAVTGATSRPPHWYRGAGAAYDAQGEQCIASLGYRIAGFSLNADDGATLGAAAVAQRLRRAQAGDIILAHMNKPASGTAEGLAAALPELLARQLRFVTLSQAAGVQPVANGRAPR